MSNVPVDVDDGDICELCCFNSSHSPIVLPHNEPVYVGRTPETKIVDPRCSRQQVQLSADLNGRVVRLTTIGGNGCAVNGQLLAKGESTTVAEDDRIELLNGQYPHFVRFRQRSSGDMGPKKNQGKAASKSPAKNDKPAGKRKIESTNDSPSPTKQQKESEPTKAKRSNNLDGYFTSSTQNKSVTEKGKWETINNGEVLVYTSAGFDYHPKVASFDMDFTLIGTKSGRVFPKDCDDWQLLFPQVKTRLKRAVEQENFRVVIFSNQAGIEKGKVDVNKFKGKVENIVRLLSIPVQGFFSIGSGICRKPCVGMWTTFAEEYCNGVVVDMQESFYCGDAAGREAVGKRKKDFSCSDRCFTFNLGLKFLTPEEYFLGDTKPAPFHWPPFEPHAYAEKVKTMSQLEPSTANIIASDQEVVIMVGCPGSGKSTFCSRSFGASDRYVIVNRDTLGTWQKCVVGMRNALASGKSVAVDNLNSDAETRKKYFQAITEVMGNKKINVRCFQMNVEIAHARHNNRFRELVSPTSHEKISDMVYNIFKSKYQEPTLSEGFSAMVKVNFIPEFKNAKEEKLYGMYLLDK